MRLLGIVAGGLLYASVGHAQAAPRTADQLIARFRQAHESKALQSVLRLVYWGKAEPAMHASLERSVTADFKRAIKRMKVEFVPQPGADQGITSTSYLVGVKDGVYFLVTAEPVAR